jgi:hypothetical protein
MGKVVYPIVDPDNDVRDTELLPVKNMVNSERKNHARIIITKPTGAAYYCR